MNDISTTVRNRAIKVFGGWRKASSWYYRAEPVVFEGKTPHYMVLVGRGEEVLHLLDLVSEGLCRDNL